NHRATEDTEKKNGKVGDGYFSDFPDGLFSVLSVTLWLEPETDEFGWRLGGTIDDVRSCDILEPEGRKQHEEGKRQGAGRIRGGGGRGAGNRDAGALAATGAAADAEGLHRQKDQARRGRRQQGAGGTRPDGARASRRRRDRGPAWPWDIPCRAHPRAQGFD